MVRVEWSPLAIRDRERIFDYIAAENPVAAVAIDEELEGRTDQLARFPESGRRGRVEGTRELVLNRTPYVAAYQVGEDVVTILRILHSAQQWPDNFG